MNNVTVVGAGLAGCELERADRAGEARRKRDHAGAVVRRVAVLEEGVSADALAAVTECHHGTLLSKKHSEFSRRARLAS